MDKAKIIAKNHEVVTYKLNGRRRYIVDEIDKHATFDDKVVFQAINEVGHLWYDVYNYIDKLTGHMPSKHMERCIDKHTIF